MSFKVNSSQQISFNDSVFSLTAREKKALDNSWAKIFADEIFPNIDEERFSVLYSSKASRPNAPVNVIIGALIIKELFDYSDDEIVENLMLDLHLQYALHTLPFYAWGRSAWGENAESLRNRDEHCARLCSEASRPRRAALLYCWFLRCTGELHGLSSLRRSAERNLLAGLLSFCLRRRGFFFTAVQNMHGLCCLLH